LILRGNKVVYAAGRADEVLVGIAAQVAGAKNVLVQGQVMDLAPANPLLDFRCGSVKYIHNDILFIEKNIYDYELPLEYAISFYWLGKHAEAIRVNEQIIACPTAPETFRESAKRNREYSLAALRP
jgi:hypothetical protein